MAQTRTQTRKRARARAQEPGDVTCTNPIRIYKHAPTDAGMDVPCGKCTMCRIKRASDWAIRCEHEMEEWEHASFIRLSYDEEHIPRDRSVNKRELQLFFKRLRKRLGTPIAYLACGEYGENKARIEGPSQLTERPHYHILLFGYGRRWGFKGDDKLRYHPNFQWNGTCWNVIHGPLKDTWGKGHITLGVAGPQSARYIAGYTLKSNVGKLNGTFHDGRTAPFLLVSRGIGKRYVARNADKLSRDLHIKKNGKELALPRQYHIWLGTTTDELKKKAEEYLQDVAEYWEARNKGHNMHLWIMADRRNKAKLKEHSRERITNATV